MFISEDIQINTIYSVSSRFIQINALIEVVFDEHWIYLNDCLVACDQELGHVLIEK